MIPVAIIREAIRSLPQDPLLRGLMLNWSSIWKELEVWTDHGDFTYAATGGKLHSKSRYAIGNITKQSDRINARIFLTMEFNVTKYFNSPAKKPSELVIESDIVDAMMLEFDTATALLLPSVACSTLHALGIRPPTFPISSVRENIQHTLYIDFIPPQHDHILYKGTATAAVDVTSLHIGA